MKTLKAFFKQKETIIGIAAAIAFQFIFVVVWLTGYDGVEQRTDQFTIGIVNEDLVIGENIVKGIADQATFKVIQFTELDEAKKELDQRTIQLYIQLPANLSENLQSNETAEIRYYINQSAPMLTKQMMEKIVDVLHGQVSLQIEEMLSAKMAEAIPGQIALQFEDQPQAGQIALQVIQVIHENQLDPAVESTIIKTNDQEGFKVTMVPLLLVLASYIGAMLVSQHLQLASQKLKSKFTQRSIFMSRQWINVLVAIGVSLITIVLLSTFNIHITSSFIQFWAFQALLMFSFLALSQLFVMLFGNSGMIFNIALTATQLVSSGAIVPRELLSNFYQKIGGMLPATYGVNSYYSFIFGGGQIGEDVKYLLIITGVLLLTAGVGMVFVNKLQRLWKRT